MKIAGFRLKERKIEDIVERVLELRAERQDEYEMRFKSWSRTCPLEFWGRDKRYENKDRVFSFSDGLGPKEERSSYSYSGVEPFSEKSIRIADEKKLPLLMVNPKYASVLPIIMKRLRGKLEGIPKRQDLIDAYIFYDKRKEKRYEIQSAYMDLLYRWVSNNYMKEIHTPHHYKSVVIMECGGRTLYFDNSTRQLKLLDDFDLLRIKV